MIPFDKIVSKLSKTPHKVVTLEEIGKIIDPDFPQVKQATKTSIYKVVYRLKSLGTLSPLRNGIYLIGSHETSAEEQIDDNYWKITKKLISQTVGSTYMITGKKALEIHMRNFEIPETLIVLNPKIDKKLQLSKNHEIVFRKIHTHNQRKKRNLFSCLFEYSLTKDVDSLSFRISSLEHSILESLTKRPGNSDFDSYLLEKVLKKYHKTLKEDMFFFLTECRYISAINRLKEFSKKKGFESIYSFCLESIKKHGNGCFVSVKSP